MTEVANQRLKKVRWAYVVLAMLSLGLSVLTVLFVIKEVSDSNHKFCQIITTSLAPGPIAQPANPKKNPGQEKLYENYILVRDLGISLGCPVPR